MTGLVDNALDFLERAFNELQASPKYSVIHFYAAVELFLKARLLAEHWSLVIAKPQEADQVKFVRGDFQSVTLDDAMKRLEKVVGSGLTVSEVQQVQRLGRHRNQMMHFYHEAAGEEAKAVRGEIALEQLRAWHTLNRLLLDRWKAVFRPWEDRIYRVDEALKDHREYLEVRYEAIRSDLATKEQAGARFTTCTACGHPANEVIQVLGLFGSAECLVCGMPSFQLETRCPGCGDSITFLDTGHQSCAACKRTVEPQELARIIEDPDYGPRHDKGLPGHCLGCNSPETVVRHDGDLICVGCFTMWDSENMSPCEWCGEVNAGPLEDSLTNGCVVCSGRFGGSDFDLD